MTKPNLLLNLGAGLALFTAAPAANAITVTIDGVSSPTLLSDAINTALSANDGNAIVDIKVDSLPTADRQIVINKPITINGDADNNGVPCDILVDINGIDPTGNAIYYFNPDTATSPWIWGRPQIKRIGKHIFCK